MNRKILGIEFTEHELTALEMLNGDKPISGGAWFNAACGYLKGVGCVKGLPYAITEKGRDVLKARDANADW